MRSRGVFTRPNWGKLVSISYLRKVEWVEELPAWHKRVFLGAHSASLASRYFIYSVFTLYMYNVHERGDPPFDIEGLKKSCVFLLFEKAVFFITFC